MYLNIINAYCVYYKHKCTVKAEEGGSDRSAAKNIFTILVHYRGLCGHIVVILNVCLGIVSQHVLNSSVHDLWFST